MQLYPHPVNEAREERGALPVNSFWLSGCGRQQPSNDTVVQVEAALRAPLLAEDWAAWAEAWRALDRGVVAALLTRAQRGEEATLTLCGERSAQRFENLPRSLRQRLTGRWTASAAHTLLEGL